MPALALMALCCLASVAEFFRYFWRTAYGYQTGSLLLEALQCALLVAAFTVARKSESSGVRRGAWLLLSGYALLLLFKLLTLVILNAHV